MARLPLRLPFRPPLALAAALLAALAAALSAAPSHAQGGFDAAAFRTFATARAGEGAPVYWYSTGELRSYPEGRLLALVEGFDTARSMPDPDRPGGVVQLSRKIYIYRDPATGAVLRAFEGRPVQPIAYPYQLIRYWLEGDRLRTHVTQGSGERVQRIGPGGNATARRQGDTLMVTAPLYLDMPMPSGARYQAFENYDFFFTGRDGLRLSWLRYGDDALTGKPSIMHMVGWRVGRFEDLPEPMRRFVEQEAPLWKAPPADMAEIARLQAGG